MREIKFRGKRLDNGEWIYGFYIEGASNGSNRILYHAIAQRGFYPVEVMPETVGQYTGLKDNNGTEIYEGDVVRCWGGAQAFGYHEFEANILIDEFYQLRVSDIGDYDEFYILGNIHENPELLEATK